jgi:hypothetical protein
MLLTDLNGEVFELKAKDIKELHTRHGVKGDYTLIATEFQLYRVQETVPYIMKLIPQEKRS